VQALQSDTCYIITKDDFIGLFCDHTKLATRSAEDRYKLPLLFYTLHQHVWSENNEALMQPSTPTDRFVFVRTHIDKDDDDYDDDDGDQESEGDDKSASNVSPADEDGIEFVRADFNDDTIHKDEELEEAFEDDDEADDIGDVILSENEKKARENDYTDVDLRDFDPNKKYDDARETQQFVTNKADKAAALAKKANQQQALKRIRRTSELGSEHSRLDECNFDSSPFSSPTRDSNSSGGRGGVRSVGGRVGGGSVGGRGDGRRVGGRGDGRRVGGRGGGRGGK